MKSCIENGQVVIAVGCGDEIIDHSNINPNSYVANLLRNTQSNRLNTDKWKNVGDGRKQHWGYNRNNNKMFTPVSKPSFHTDGFDSNFKNEVNTELALAADSKDKAVEYATSVETYQDLSSPVHSLNYKMLNELQDDPSFDELEYHSENQPKGWPIFKHGVERESNAAFHSTNTLHLEGDTHKDFHEYPQSPIDILGAYNPLASNALQNKNFNYHSTDSVPNALAYGFNGMNDKLTDGFTNDHKVSFTDHNVGNKVVSSSGHDTNGVYMHAGMLHDSQMHDLTTENSGNVHVWLNNHEHDHANYQNNYHNQQNYYNHNNVHDHDLVQSHNLDHNHDQTQQNTFQNFDSHHGYNENSGNTGRVGAGSEFDSQLGHTYNLGGSIVHAVGDPFAGLEYSFNSPILNHPSGKGDNGMLGAMIAAGGGATSGAVFGVGGPSSEKISEPMFEGNSAVSVKVADQSSGDNNKNSITSGNDAQSKDNKIQAGEKSNDLGNGSPIGSNSGISNNGDINGKGDAAGDQGNINKVSEKNGNNQGKGNGGNENGGSLSSSGLSGNSNTGFDVKNEKSLNEGEPLKENQGGINGANNGNVNNVGANKPNNGGSSSSGVKDGENGRNGMNTNNRKYGNDRGDSEKKQENNSGAGGNSGTNNINAAGNGKNGNTNGSGNKSGGNTNNGEGNGNQNDGGANEKNISGPNGSGREASSQEKSRADGGGGNLGYIAAKNMGAGGNGKNGNTNGSGNENGGNVSNGGGNANSNNAGGFNDNSNSVSNGGGGINNQDNSKIGGGSGNSGSSGANNMGAGGNGKNGNANSSGNNSGGNISNEVGKGNSNNGGSFNQKGTSGPDGRGREANNQESSRTDGACGNLGYAGSNNMGAGGNGKNGNTNGSGDKSGGNVSNGGCNGNVNTNNGGGFNGNDGKKNEGNNQENLRASGGSGNVGNGGANNMGAGEGNAGNIGAKSNGAGGNGKNGSYDDKSGGNVSNGSKGNSNNANGLYGKNCNGPNGREKEANNQENSRTSCVDGNSGNDRTDYMGDFGTGNNRNTDSFKDRSRGNAFYNGGNELANNAGRINGDGPEGRVSEINNQKNLKTSGNSGKIGANNMGASGNENDLNTNGNSNKYGGSLPNGSGSGNSVNGGGTNGRNGNCPDGSVSGANSQKNSKIGGDNGNSANTANNWGAGGNENNGNANGFVNKNGDTTLDGGPNGSSNNGDTNCHDGKVSESKSQKSLKMGEGGGSSVNIENYKWISSGETGMIVKDNSINGGGTNGKNNDGSDKRESTDESQNIMKGAGGYNQIKSIEKNYIDESKPYGSRRASESNNGNDRGGCTFECNNKFNTGGNGKSSLTSDSGDIRGGNIIINNRGSGFFSESAGNAGSSGISPDERKRNENQGNFINPINFKNSNEARDIGIESSNIFDNNMSGDRERALYSNNIGTNSLFNRFGFSLDNRIKSNRFYDGNDHTSNEYGLTNARVNTGVDGVSDTDKSKFFKYKNLNQNTIPNQNQNINFGNMNFGQTENIVNHAFEDGQKAAGSKNDLAGVFGANFHNNNQDINVDHESNKDFTKLNVNSFDALRGSTIVEEPTHRGNNILFTDHSSEIFPNNLNGRSYESREGISSREGVSCIKGIECNIVSGVNELGSNNPTHEDNNIQSSDNQIENILVQSSSAAVPSKSYKIGSRVNGDSKDHNDGDVDHSNKVEIDKIENYNEIKNGPNVRTGSNQNVNMSFGNNHCNCNKDTSLVEIDRYCPCNKAPPLTDSQNPGGNLTHQFVKFFENIAGKLHVNELVAVEEIVENIKNSHKSQTKTNLHQANIRVSSPVVKDKLPIPQEKLNNYFSPAIKTIVET